VVKVKPCRDLDGWSRNMTGPIIIKFDLTPGEIVRRLNPSDGRKLIASRFKSDNFAINRVLANLCKCIVCGTQRLFWNIVAKL
jgi:hypothetical protein